MKKTMMLVITICMSLSLFGCFDDVSLTNNTQDEQQSANQQSSREQTNNDQTEKEQTAKEQAEKEQAAKEQAEKEQAAKEQAEKEQAAKEQAEKEQAAKKQAEKEQSNIDIASGTPVTSEIIDDENFGDTVNKFAYKTSSQFINEEKANANYSPISLYYALAVATDGSNGDTQKELLNLLGVSSTEKLSSRCKELYPSLNENYENSKMQIANSMWISKGFNNISDKFKNNAKDNYYAPVYDDIDFASPKDLLRMSKWVSDNTNNTLNPKFDSVDDTVLAIINTIYFNNQWQDCFYEDFAVNDTFHANDKDEDVTFMRRTAEQSSYAKGEGFTRSSLEFVDGSSMVFILPDEGIKTTDLLSTTEKAKDVFEGGTEGNANVVWSVPKFEFDCSFDMVNQLRKLNVNLPFSDSEADFTNISEKGLFLKLDKILALVLIIKELKQLALLRY